MNLQDRNWQDRNIKFWIAMIAAIMFLSISGILYFTGYGQHAAAAQTATQQAISQPLSASQVAAQLHCGKFKDLGSGLKTNGMTVDTGSCWIGSKKYAIDTFVSAAVRDEWLKLAEPYGVDPKWESDTSVTYPSVTS